MTGNKKPGMPGFLLCRNLLRRCVQRCWRRDRNGFDLVDVLLDLVQQRTWFYRFLWLWLLGVFSRGGYGGAAVLAENRFVTAHARHEITRQADKLVVRVEDNADAFLLAFTAAWLQA